MQHGNLAFTAVFLKVPQGYVGFVEELPQVTAHARTLDEARKSLHELAAVIFDAERESTRELLAGREVVREDLVIPISGAHSEAGDPEHEVTVAHVREPPR